MVCCSVTLQHSGAQILTLGLPRSSGVAHTITQGLKTPVQSVLSCATPACGHVPDATLVVIQPAESLYLAGALVRVRKPANKACAALCWCFLPMAGIYWPEQWIRAARQSTAITSAAMRPLGSRRQSPVAGDQSPVAGGHRALKINVWATYPAVEVHADTLAV